MHAVAFRCMRMRLARRAGASRPHASCNGRCDARSRPDWPCGPGGRSGAAGAAGAAGAVGAVGAGATSRVEGRLPGQGVGQREDGVRSGRIDGREHRPRRPERAARRGGRGRLAARVLRIDQLLQRHGGQTFEQPGVQARPQLVRRAMAGARTAAIAAAAAAAGDDGLVDGADDVRDADLRGRAAQQVATAPGPVNATEVTAWVPKTGAI